MKSLILLRYPHPIPYIIILYTMFVLYIRVLYISVIYIRVNLITQLWKLVLLNFRSEVQLKKISFSLTPRLYSKNRFSFNIPSDAMSLKINFDYK